MSKMTRKPRNRAAQESTLINDRATKKREAAYVKRLSGHIARMSWRLAQLESQLHQLVRTKKR